MLMPDSKWNAMTASQLIDEDFCPAWVLPSEPVLGRCLPFIVSDPDGHPNKTVFAENEVKEGSEVKEATINGAVTSLGAFLSVRGFGERVFNDIKQTWWMISAGLGSACLVSFLWIVLMRFVAGVMIWTSIGLCFVAFGGLFGFTLHRYITFKDLPEATGNIFTVNWTPDFGNDLLAQANTWLAFAIVTGIIFLVIILVLVAMRKRIQIAIELIEQGSKAVSNMMSTLFFPIIPFVMQLCTVFFFAVVALHLSSASDAEYRVGYPIEMKDQVSLRYCFIILNCFLR
jgi:choline transporter-like protein 2/4/5